MPGPVPAQVDVLAPDLLLEGVALVDGAVRVERGQVHERRREAVRPAEEALEAPCQRQPGQHARAVRDADVGVDVDARVVARVLGDLQQVGEEEAALAGVEEEVGLGAEADGWAHFVRELGVDGVRADVLEAVGDGLGGGLDVAGLHGEHAAPAALDGHGVALAEHLSATLGSAGVGEDRVEGEAHAVAL